jgi:arylsulfatase A-like enzyme
VERRRFLELLGAMTAGAAASAQPAERPNILLILGDCQQWCTIAGRSEARTPHINRLAGQGMLFNRAYSPSAVCSPARNALLTGAFNWKFGTWNHPDSGEAAVSRDLFPGVTTYAQRLRDAGYRLGYNGKWHSSIVRIPTELGYHDIGAPDRYKQEALRKLHALGLDNVKTKARTRPVRWASWPGSKPFPVWSVTECEEEESDLYQYAESGIRMMKRYARGNSPWLVEIHFPEAYHNRPLKKYVERYDPANIRVGKNFYDTFEGKPGLQRREAESYGAFTETDYREGRAHYYAAVEQLDAQVGRILKALDETGQAERTLVVFAADHGVPFGAHRMWRACFAPYEENYRIPMVVRWPGRIRPGAVCDHLAQLHDLAHTFVDVAGAPALPQPHGLSLTPLFDAPARADWRDMIQSPWFGQDFLLSYRMTITRRYKYVFNAYDYDECYDLEEDPDELRNIARDPSRAAPVADMQARTWELMNRYQDPWGDAAPVEWYAHHYLPRGKRLVR